MGRWTGWADDECRRVAAVGQRVSLSAAHTDEQVARLREALRALAS